MERLQKFLSRAGVASRRHAETLITDGRVKVNGKVVTELGSRVDGAKDLVLVDGKLVSASSERRYFLLYKPPGVVTTMSDPEGRPTIADYARETGGRVFPVGRLDYDAEGALLLTDDGELANKLMHPSHQVPRVYLAKVKGEPDQASLEKLVAGVRLEDGMARAVEARIYERAERNTWVKLVVTEGRQHLVKRLCAAIGHPVVRLFRPAHAGIGVQGLRPGELRSLSHDEIRRVKGAADGTTAEQPPLALPARRHGHAAPGFEPEMDEAPSRERREEKGAPRSESTERSESRDSDFGAGRSSPRRSDREGPRMGRERSGGRSFGARGSERGEAPQRERSFGGRERGESPQRERRERSDAPQRERSFGGRERSESPQRERSFGGRERGEAPQRERSGRSGERSFGRREQGEGASRGERSRFGGPRGEGRGRGDERGRFGERKRFGERRESGSESSRGDRSERAGRSDRRIGGEGRSAGFGKRKSSAGGRPGRGGAGESRFSPERKGPRGGSRSSPRKPRGSW